MKTLQFKTNINCGGCVAKVTPGLDQAEGIVAWKVDTNNPDKVLTVETGELNADAVPAAVMEIVKKAGFTIQPL